ncbi:MAG: ribose 5-phosphate isomerase B [Proteobacteria bacterium]|nr:ribose 5-phosphate isomerase B [Desulfobulbaceae bacterium]MBU4153195.1 ribose 5-phosphate isomerase B [Pseudomonadota bacterium]
MRVAVGSDHGGIKLKKKVVRLLEHDRHQVLDMGCYSDDSVDYPVFARSVCSAILNGEAELGILICGTGIGMSMAANRFKGIRAALCHEQFTARMSREHNDANVLCVGARVVGSGLALEMVRTWLNTDFGGGRHLRRIEMF